MTRKRSPLGARIAIAGCAAGLTLALVGSTAATPALASTSAVPDPAAQALEAARADLLLIVDCMLPGQVRSLGSRTTYVSARRPVRTTARDCQIRGGEFVAYDRADVKSALAAWLPRAEAGDVEAQVVTGEIYERGIGVAPDYAAALRWYGVAAGAGSTRAQVNLGHLHERGLGVPRDAALALQWYRRAAGMAAAIELDVPASEPATPAVPDQVAARMREVETSLATLSSELATTRAALARAEEARASAPPAVATVNRTAEIESLRRDVATREQELERSDAERRRLAAGLANATERAELLQKRVTDLEKPIAQRLLAAPQVAIVEPALPRTRDIVPVALVAATASTAGVTTTTDAAERQVVGRVTAPAGLVALTVNDRPVTANELGVFSIAIPTIPGDTPVTVVAVDRQGKRGEARFTLRTATPRERNAAPAAAAAPTLRDRAFEGVEFGTFHALVIGNDAYQALPRLATPVADATALADVLRTHYGFRTTVLTNATRYQILSALNTLREQLTPNDNLLVYYAGHGELDEVNQRGHWLPVDAERSSTANWIPSTAITDILNVMRAKQVLVIADSCYSGALTRSSVGRLATGMTSAERAHWFRTMAGKRSRTALTSGGLQPVLDAGGGRHSVFAKALLEVLDGNAEPLDGQRLHREVAARVAYAAANLRFDQLPEYAPIRFAGHEAGEFFFIPQR